FQSLYPFAILPHFQNHFDHIIHVTLSVHAPRDGKPDQVHLGRGSEHQCADLDRTNSTLQVQLGSERNPGELFLRNVRQKGSSVQVDRVSARRLHNRNSLFRDVIAKISGGGDTIAEVVLLQGLLYTDRNRLEVATGESAVCGTAFRQNQQILFLRGQLVVIGAEKAADVGHTIFLRRHGAAVSIVKHLLGDLLRGLGLVARLPQLDEVSVLGETTRVEVEWQSVLPAHLADLADVLHRNRLP